MIKGTIIGKILIYTFIVLMQVIVFKEMVLFGMAFCFIYVLIFILVPKEINPLILLLIGFIIGLIVDSFYNSQGMHVVVSVFIMFIRPFWMNMNTPSGGFAIGTRVNIKEQGFQWFVIYAFPIIFIHHLLLFSLEAASFKFFFSVLQKTVFSSFFTLLIVVLSQYMFVKNKKY